MIIRLIHTEPWSDSKNPRQFSLWQRTICSVVYVSRARLEALSLSLYTLWEYREYRDYGEFNLTDFAQCTTVLQYTVCSTEYLQSSSVYTSEGKVGGGLMRAVGPLVRATVYQHHLRVA